MTDRFGRTFSAERSPGGTYILGVGLAITLPGSLSDDQVLAYVEALPPPGEHRTPEQIAADARAAMPPVSAHRLLMALDAAGLLDAIETFVATQPRAVQLAWARTPEFHRDDPMLTAGAASMGLSEEQVDALFAAATNARGG